MYVYVNDIKYSVEVVSQYRYIPPLDSTQSPLTLQEPEAQQGVISDYTTTEMTLFN